MNIFSSILKNNRTGALTILVATILYGSSVHAGWYVVNNYDGSIGSYKIQLSMQTLDRPGDGANIIGSYYYDSHRTPIPLYGRKDGTNVILCEVSSVDEYKKRFVIGSDTNIDINSCQFKLILDAKKMYGTWQSKAKQYAVTLAQTAFLDNTRSPTKVDGKVEIPFWGQTSLHSFIGIYKKNQDTGEIDDVRVVNKLTGKVDQIIHPQSQSCEFGFVTTPIYMNLSGADSSEEIYLNCAAGDSPDYVELKLDKKNGIFRADEQR